MKIAASEPVVTRRTLDRLGEEIDTLRELLNKAKSGSRHEYDRLVRRALRAGNGLTQEEFDDLVAWAPLLESFYLEGAIQSHCAADDCYEAWCWLMANASRRLMQQESARSTLRLSR